MNRLLLRLTGLFRLSDISSAIRHKRAINQLRALSDRELSDIGISRGEIRHIVTHGRYVDNNVLSTFTVVKAEQRNKVESASVPDNSISDQKIDTQSGRIAA